MIINRMPLSSRQAGASAANRRQTQKTLTKLDEGVLMGNN
jgi:hypothetical protein